MLSSEQIKMRLNGIGASEIPAVVGVSPWRSPMDVWLEKTGRSEPFQGNTRTKIGNILESHIIQWWAEKRGATELRAFPEPVVDPTEPWLFATPDHAAVVEGMHMLCEAKYVGWRVRDQWADDTTPEYVLVQTQLQQHITGIRQAEVAAWIEGDYEGERIVPCPYMPELTRDMIEVAREFWFDYVQKDTPPPVDASDAWRGYLKTLYPREKLPIIEAPPEADALVERYVRSARSEKHGNVQKLEAEHELCLLIGENGGLDRRGRYRVTWYADKAGRRRFYVKEFGK